MVLLMSFDEVIHRGSTFVLYVRVVKVVTFKVPKELYEEIDDAVIKYGFYNRSEFIKKAIEEYVKYLESAKST